MATCNVCGKSYIVAVEYEGGGMECIPCWSEKQKRALEMNDAAYARYDKKAAKVKTGGKR